MWSVQTIPVLKGDSPTVVKESSNIAPLMPSWNKVKTYRDVVSTIWDGEKLIMFHIPQKLRTPELTSFFQDYNKQNAVN